MRIMAIDYGDAHTGVAVSDPTGFLTGDVTIIHSRKAEVVLEELTRQNQLLVELLGAVNALTAATLSIRSRFVGEE